MNLVIFLLVQWTWSYFYEQLPKTKTFKCLQEFLLCQNEVTKDQQNQLSHFMILFQQNVQNHGNKNNKNPF